MIERIEGIVTDIVKHNDSHNVVTLFTRRRGRMAFLVPVGKSKAGRMRNALLTYMAVVSADVNIRSGKDLYPLRGVQPVRLWHGIYADPVKSALLFFLTEFCSRLLRQYPADERLWQFLIGSLETLDASVSSRIANFHIAFLTSLLPLAGIEPNLGSGTSGTADADDSLRFDMLSAEMVDVGRPGPVQRRVLLSAEESRFVPLLSRINFSNMHRFRLTPSQRRHVLEKLLAYYSLHLPVSADYRSLPVLHELFS